MITAVFCLAILSLLGCVQSYPYAGGNNQWSNPGVGMTGGHQQQQGFGNGRQQEYSGERGFGNNFGGQQGGGHSQNRGGRQPWQSGQGSEVFRTNVFNEPDRYGYDYTFPGATVHYLMYKKQSNRGSGNYGGNQGGNQGGWNNNY